MKPYYIEWIDISSNGGTWTDYKDVGIEDECLVKQVGYIVKEDKQYIWITECHIESLKCYGNITKIPKVVIRKRKVIKL